MVWEMGSHSMATRMSVLVTEHCSASGTGTGHKVGIIVHNVSNISKILVVMTFLQILMYVYYFDSCEKDKDVHMQDHVYIIKKM